jgi:glutathione S-transferase
MTAKLSVYRWVPPFAQGLVRDLRVRWALNEAGEPYAENLVALSEKEGAPYRRLQPFGQVPAFEDQDGLVLFESGAIVLQIAERSPVLMPEGAHGRARTRTWVFAAVNSVEPPIMFLNVLEQLQVPAGDPVRQKTEGWAKLRLTQLSEWLDGRDYLEGAFSAGDLMMSTVLRILHTTTLLDQLPTLRAYRERCESRPAFQRALADQLSTFADNAPAAA